MRLVNIIKSTKQLIHFSSPFINRHILFLFLLIGNNKESNNINELKFSDVLLSDG